MGKIVMVFPQGERVGCMIIPHWGEGGRKDYGLPAREVGLWSLPAGGEGGLHDHSSLGERVGEMVMVFPLGELVSWFLPAWGVGGLHAVSPLGERGEGGGVILPTGGEGYLFVKLILVFVCCCVRFSVANFSLSRGCGFQFYILLVFLFVFVACFSLSVFSFVIWPFREFSDFKICFASSDFKKFILSFSVCLKDFGEILLFYCTTSWIFTRKFNLTSQVAPKQPNHSFSFIFVKNSN